VSGLFVFGAIAGAAAAASVPFLVRTWKRLFPPGPEPLPPPGGPPENRGEAVRRVLKHLQRKTIAELEDGTACVIIGTVKAIPGVTPLRSPVHRIECLGFHLDVRLAELDESFRLAQIYDLARIVEIEVDDGTGTVRVSADGLELAITDAPLEQWQAPLPKVLLDIVPPRFQHRPLTVEEGVLRAGARILVCGVAVRELGVTNYRDGASTLVLRATSTFPLVASTDEDLFRPGDRPIAPEELRRRRR
jgi:hypothetical protein